MRLSVQKILIALGISIIPFSSYGATDKEITDIKQEISNIKQEIKQLSDNSKQLQENNSSPIEDKLGNITITGGLTNLLQGANETEAGGKTVIDYSYTFGLNLTAKVSESSKVVVRLTAGNGNGLNDNIDIFSSVNYTASHGAASSNTISITQAYYEGEYYDGSMTASFGRMDIHGFTDGNEYANDGTNQFISAIFSQSQGSIFTELDEYYAPGLAIWLTLADWADINIVAASGKGSGFEDITNNPYLSTQLTLRNNIENYNGNYRFYLISDYRDYTEISTGNAKENIGFGISFDQEVWKDRLGIFARYGVQDDELDENIVKSGYSIGLQEKFPYNGGEKHIVGLAYGKLMANDKSSLFSTNPKNETHIEFYYKLQVNDYFALSPDIQYIINSGGNNSSNMLIYGLRARLNF